MKKSSLKTFSINAHMRLITNTYIIIIYHNSCNKIQCEYPTCATIPWCSECYYSKSMVNDGDV